MLTDKYTFLFCVVFSLEFLADQELSICLFEIFFPNLNEIDLISSTDLLRFFTLKRLLQGGECQPR